LFNQPIFTGLVKKVLWESLAYNGSILQQKHTNGKLSLSILTAIFPDEPGLAG